MQPMPGFLMGDVWVIQNDVLSRLAVIRGRFWDLVCKWLIFCNSFFWFDGFLIFLTQKVFMCPGVG